jgi:hypothetical protein
VGLALFPDLNGRHCGVKDWDPMVYAGVVDRIDNYFMNRPSLATHDKVELLQRDE